WSEKPTALEIVGDDLRHPLAKRGGVAGRGIGDRGGWHRRNGDRHRLGNAAGNVDLDLGDGRRREGQRAYQDAEGEAPARSLLQCKGEACMVRAGPENRQGVAKAHSRLLAPPGLKAESGDASQIAVSVHLGGPEVEDQV